jgi:hypothetical protein
MYAPCSRRNSSPRASASALPSGVHRSGQYISGSGEKYRSSRCTTPSRQLESKRWFESRYARLQVGICTVVPGGITCPATTHGPLPGGGARCVPLDRAGCRRIVSLLQDQCQGRYRLSR